MRAFSLTVPPDLRALRTVQAFIEQSALLYGFKDKEKFSLIAEEAFLHTILKLEKEENDIPVEIITEGDEKYFIISFRDKGIPFGREEELSEIEKAELNIIRANCTKLKWVNLGKKGTELKIFTARPQKDITELKFPFEVKKNPVISAENIEVEILNPEDSYQVSRLVYISYGYTYPNEDLYYPERIKSLNLNGKLISIVARDKSINKVVGHYALEIYNSKYIAELGQAVVDLDYRGLGIFVKLRKKLEKTAKEREFKGILSQPVTSHLKTQKTNEKFGSKACGISFGLTPKEFDFRKMGIKPLSERETCFFYYKPIIIEERKIIIPKKHKQIISEIYRNIGLSVSELKNPSKSETTLIDSNYFSGWGFGTIDVKQACDDFENKFEEVFFELRYSARADAIFLNIPMVFKEIDSIVDFVEKKGFFFTGVAPYYVEGNDCLRFEYLNTLVDVSRIKAFAPFAKTILDYCSEQMRRAL